MYIYIKGEIKVDPILNLFLQKLVKLCITGIIFHIYKSSESTEFLEDLKEN